MFFVYPPKFSQKRRELATEMAAQILDSNNEVYRCVVFSRDTSRWDEAYNSVFILDRRPNKPEPASEAKAAVVA